MVPLYICTFVVLLMFIAADDITVYIYPEECVWADYLCFYWQVEADLRPAKQFSCSQDF